MDARTWLGLEPTHNPHRWVLPVTPDVSTGHGYLFGGSGLGAAIAALEGTSGRPLVWATAQYLSFAKTGSILDIDVTIAVEGRATTQARAVCHVGGAEIITVNAALGQRSLDADMAFGEMPQVRPPDECMEKPPFGGSPTAMSARMEQRWAVPAGHEPSATPVALGPGRVALWMHLPELLENSAAALAVLGDYVPMGVSVASGGRVGGNSLDNTLRVIKVVPTEWFLVDVHVEGVHNGFAHGFVHIWSDTGVLMATASQSAFVRARDPENHEPPRRLSEAPD